MGGSALPELGFPGSSIPEPVISSPSTPPAAMDEMIVPEHAILAPPPPERKWPPRDWRKYAPLKVSIEYDSEEKAFMNKISTRLANGIAKIKTAFQRDLQTGEIRSPTIGFNSKYLSVLYDHEERNALVTAVADVGSHIRLKYLRDIKAQQGEVKLIARSNDAKYVAEVGYDVPAMGLPRASLTFPNGELKLEEEHREDGSFLSINGLIGAKALNGLVVAEYRDENIGLKYKYKDAEMTIVPSISLPSQSLALSFKRQFDPYNKMSYFYNFDNAAWSAVYKHQSSERFKIKAGYDSNVRIGWAALWVGREESGAKEAPKKCKLQVMLQVPQDDIRSAALLWKVKKRWDL